ncbi:MAG: DNA-3-methyladenine glycosylase 2 family protein [Deinococcota bacterium]
MSRLDTDDFFTQTFQAPSDAYPTLGQDATLNILINHIGSCEWRCHSLFFTAVRAVVGQSISTKAAQTVFNRILEATRLEPTTILALDEPDLLALGLSKQKVTAITGLAQLEVNGQLTTSDLAVLTERITAIRGIGVWTAEMIAIFSLGADDIWPISDLALIFAGRDLYDVTGKPALRNLGEQFRPYRSIAMWYFWRWVELGQPELKTLLKASAPANPSTAIE